VTTWQLTTRPAHPRNPQVVLFAFSSGPLRAAPPVDPAPCRLHLVACEPRGVVDLAYLQAAWALVRPISSR
jgi:hypothetical protein